MQLGFISGVQCVMGTIDGAYMNLKKIITLLADISIKYYATTLLLLLYLGFGNHKKHLISGVRVRGLRPQIIHLVTTLNIFICYVSTVRYKF